MNGNGRDGTGIRIFCWGNVLLLSSDECPGGGDLFHRAGLWVCIILIDFPLKFFIPFVFNGMQTGVYHW